MRIASAACCLAVAGGHLASLARAQVTPPNAPAAVAPAPPAATVLGPVGQHNVALMPDATLIDVFYAAKPLPGVDLSRVLVVRCNAEAVLCVQIDVRKMMKAGSNENNIQIRDGDLLLFPDAGHGGHG